MDIINNIEKASLYGCDSLKCYPEPVACTPVAPGVKELELMKFTHAERTILKEMRKRVETLGYAFGSDEMFKDFCKENITLVSPVHYKEQHVFLYFSTHRQQQIGWIVGNEFISNQ